MSTLDLNNDDLDAILFRFWIRAASEFPSETMIALCSATTADAYRVALLNLARVKKVNLPHRATASSLVMAQAGLVDSLRAALAEVVDGTPAHHLAEQHGMTIERASEIRKLAGLDASDHQGSNR
ncbi:hypothetical protein [Kaistia sp. MMO-174]|uniref:hypothetical protein n=1 Tax=Kaistia sp. MMO-174 TaxID=3081256 RepID=UPI003015C470